MHNNKTSIYNRRARERESSIFPPSGHVYVFSANEYASMHVPLVLDGVICVQITRDCIDN